MEVLSVMIWCSLKPKKKLMQRILRDLQNWRRMEPQASGRKELRDTLFGAVLWMTELSYKLPSLGSCLTFGHVPKLQGPLEEPRG